MPLPRLHIYSAQTLAQLPWPEGDFALRQMLSALLEQGPEALIQNADVTVLLLAGAGQVFPITLPPLQASEARSYVCSPTSHYLHYARVELELELAAQPRLKALCHGLLNALEIVLQPLQMEAVVYVNNWLLSTNLYPNLPTAQIPELVAEMHQTLLQRFPNRALVFRSVNLELCQDWYRALQTLGYEAVFSRQVYLLDAGTGAYRRKKSVKEDRRRLRHAPYVWSTADRLQADEIPRLKALYDQLYLDKYSQLNPRFTLAFFEQALRENWFEIQVLRQLDSGRIDAVIGFFVRDGVMTTPLVGYDRGLPETVGLYRLLSLRLLEIAEARHWVFNLSSGAAAFKRHRGATACMEYNLVYSRHLPLRQRLLWQGLARLTHRVVEPLMQKYEL